MTRRGDLVRIKEHIGQILQVTNNPSRCEFYSSVRKHGLGNFLWLPLMDFDGNSTTGLILKRELQTMRYLESTMNTRGVDRICDGRAALWSRNTNRSRPLCWVRNCEKYRPISHHDGDDSAAPARERIELMYSDKNDKLWERLTMCLRRNRTRTNLHSLMKDLSGKQIAKMTKMAKPICNEFEWKAVEESLLTELRTNPAGTFKLRIKVPCGDSKKIRKVFHEMVVCHVLRNFGVDLAKLEYQYCLPPSFELLLSNHKVAANKPRAEQE